MYHRFHAPLDCRLREVVYIAGDTWNVNPVALRRIEKLYCKNERVVLELLDGDGPAGLCMVPVAAILVASVRLHCLDNALNGRYRGPRRIGCDAAYARGEEMGYFEHGSTIILFAERGHSFYPGITSGGRLAAGEALLVRHD
jgi:phosphatidylserine decarboxylase